MHEGRLCPGQIHNSHIMSSSSSSSSSSNSSNSSTSPHLIDQEQQEPPLQGSDSNSEDNLIETLKRSLKLTDNTFLESEIEDLKEFFTVQLTDDLSTNTTTNSSSSQCQSESSVIWLKVCLPITIKAMDRVTSGKPVISFRIELKPHLEAEQQQPPHDPENFADNEMSLPYLITDCKVEEELMDDSDNEHEHELPTNNNNNNAFTSSAYSRLKSIFSELLKSKEISLLNLIEDFYINLEESNYPEKEVICRDYYYPVFDSRHWGRSNLVKSANANGSSSNLFHLLATNSTTTTTTTNNSSTTINSTTISSITISSPPSQAIIYRARALYDFQALMQGELSFQENEILLVFANLGNGWLTARRVTSTGVLDADDATVGLIPENYIERL